MTDAGAARTAAASASPAPRPDVLGCPNGHRFDVNRRGYVTLLPPRSRVVGDSASMLDAREAVLSSGAYAPIREALVGAVRPCEPRAVLDSGTGTGWYLHGLLDALSAEGTAVRGLASDLSPAAVARALRGRPDIDGLVADVHAPLPVRDAVADAVTVVFAPRNPVEFARILRPGGILAVVVPRAEHLAELRTATDMLDVPEGKADALEQSLAGWFGLTSARPVSYELPLSAELAAQLQGMGPSAHHLGRGSGEWRGDRENGAPGERVPLPASVTVSVDVLAYERRPSAEA